MNSIPSYGPHGVKKVKGLFSVDMNSYAVLQGLFWRGRNNIKKPSIQEPVIESINILVF